MAYLQGYQISFNLCSLTYRTRVLTVQVVQMLDLYAEGRVSVPLAYTTSTLNSSVRLQF